MEHDACDRNCNKMPRAVACIGRVAKNKPEVCEACGNELTDFLHLFVLQLARSSSNDGDGDGDEGKSQTIFQQFTFALRACVCVCPWSAMRGKKSHCLHLKVPTSRFLCAFRNNEHNNNNKLLQKFGVLAMHRAFAGISFAYNLQSVAVPLSLSLGSVHSEGWKESFPFAVICAQSCGTTVYLQDDDCIFKFPCGG